MQKLDKLDQQAGLYLPKKLNGLDIAFFHEYEISDHASTYFSMDFLPQSQGLGVFRAHPSLLKNQDFKNHINNVIIHTILDEIENKNRYDNFRARSKSFNFSVLFIKFLSIYYHPEIKNNEIIILKILFLA